MEVVVETVHSYQTSAHVDYMCRRMQEFFQHTKLMLIALFESIKIILRLKKSVFSNNLKLATFHKKVPNLSMTYYLTRELNKHIIFASTKDN